MLTKFAPRWSLQKFAFAGMIFFASAAFAAREHIQIVGSSTVYPFATVVAEKFGKSTAYKTPIVEATGSGGGLKLFCAGSGDARADFASASRRIKKSELAKCRANKVGGIVEIKIGYDGIVMANSRRAPRFDLTRRDIFLALAKKIPGEDAGTFIENPNQKWSDVRADLPAVKIETLGPPPTSGTRDAFVELAMEGGCKKIPAIAKLKKTDNAKYKNLCHAIREDGAFIEVGENDNLIVQKLEKNPRALGIFGFSFLDQNNDVVQGARVDGVPPEFAAIARGEYPVSRPLYLYMKAAHVNVRPGMREFVAELTHEETWGDDGYLAERGLIPMPAAERAEYQRATTELIPLAWD